ncbi:MAG: acetyl-coenzyme A synthetase N-terminal domain-containing protein, partial [Myxococcota bacterium]
MASTAWGRLSDHDHEAQHRQDALNDPGSYHGDIAAGELHWFEDGRWVNRDPVAGRWHAFNATTGAPEDPGLGSDWRPWTRAFDDSDAPFFRWFEGAQTNACFNEVDRHVLSGNGARAAFVFEGDRWDPSKNDGRGGPVVEQTISYRELL